MSTSENENNELEEKRNSWYPEDDEEQKFGTDAEFDSNQEESTLSNLEGLLNPDDSLESHNENIGENGLEDELDTELFEGDEANEEEQEETATDVDYDELYGTVLGVKTRRTSSTDAALSNRILDISNVERLINKLSKVKLVWPEDLPFFNKAEFKKHPS